MFLEKMSLQQSFVFLVEAESTDAKDFHRSTVIHNSKLL